MNPPYRSTPHGTVETSRRVLALLAVAFTVLGALFTSSAWAVRKSDQIASSTSRQEFLDTTKALRGQITYLKNDNLRQDSIATSQGDRILGLLCRAPNNRGSDFCKGVPKE